MKCPKCGSANTRYRENRQNYICDDCDFVFVDNCTPAQRVFISYGHDGYSKFALKLADALKESGYEIFIDIEGIRNGEQWEINLENGLNWTNEKGRNGLFLLLMTPHSVRRPDGFCLNEIAYAIDIKLKIIPVMLKEVTPPLSIYRLQYYNLPIEDKEDCSVYEASISKIISVLKNTENFDTSGGFRKLEKDLKPLDFNNELKLYSRNFVGRKWIFNIIDTWLETNNRTLLITGMPGIGKTAISTYLYHKLKNVLAFYMFRRDDNEKLSIKSFVTTIAFQISTQIPEYREFLLDTDIENLLSRFQGVTLFRKLIAEPLSGTRPSIENKVILIDGLDEAEREGQNRMANIIAACSEELPDWLHTIILSRPVSSVMIPFSFAQITAIKPDCNDNLSDLMLYVKNKLPNMTEEMHSSIVDKSEGSFLYAKFACDNTLSRSTADLPYGMSQFYFRTFGELFPNVDEYASKARHILEYLVASPYPLPQALLMEFTECDSYELNTFKNKMRPFLQLYSNNYIRLYHSSLAEWLLDDMSSGIYWINTKGIKDKMSKKIKELIKKNLDNYNGLEDYKQKRKILEQTTGTETVSKLFDLYLTILESEKDWREFIRFSTWYLGVPASSSIIYSRICEIQDRHIDILNSLEEHRTLYDAWENQIAQFIRLYNEQTAIDSIREYGRPVISTNLMYFIKNICIGFLNENHSQKTLETRCAIVKKCFEHSRYDFLCFESLHEDTMCSIFADELREHFSHIYNSGKIKDPETIIWLEKVKSKKS